MSKLTKAELEAEAQAAQARADEAAARERAALRRRADEAAQRLAAVTADGEAAARDMTTLRRDIRFMWTWLAVAMVFSLAGNVGHWVTSLAGGSGVAHVIGLAWAVVPPTLLLLAVEAVPTAARVNADRRDLVTAVTAWVVILLMLAASAAGVFLFLLGVGYPTWAAALFPAGIDLSVFIAARNAVTAMPKREALRARIAAAEQARADAATANREPEPQATAREPQAQPTANREPAPAAPVAPPASAAARPANAVHAAPSATGFAPRPVAPPTRLLGADTANRDARNAPTSGFAGSATANREPVREPNRDDGFAFEPRFADSPARPAATTHREPQAPTATATGSAPATAAIRATAQRLHEARVSRKLDADGIADILIADADGAAPNRIAADLGVHRDVVAKVLAAARELDAVGSDPVPTLAAVGG